MEVRFPERHEKWSSILDEWKASGLSGAAFCRERGITYWNFTAWKRRLQVVKENPCQFVAVEFEKDVDRQDCGVDVMLGQGLRLVLARGFDEEEMLRAIAALQGAKC
jgi:hypothetical protein